MRLLMGLIPALTLFTLTLLVPVQAVWRANHAKSTRDTISHGVDIRTERIERTLTHRGPRRNDVGRYARHRRLLREKRDWHDVLVEKEREKRGEGMVFKGVDHERRSAEGACVLGAWKCVGQELQREWDLLGEWWRSDSG